MTDSIKKLPFWELLTKNEQEIVKHRAFKAHYKKGSQITFETHMTAGQDTDALIISSDVIASFEDNINVKCFCMSLQ